MPEPEVKNKKPKSIYPKELLEAFKNDKTADLPPIGHDSLTGITSFRPEAQAPTGRYKKLYEEGKIDLFGDRSNWEEIAYQNQSFFEIAKNTFLGTLLNLTAGFIDSAGSSDIKGIFDTAMGNTEENYGNIVHDFAQSIMKYSEDEFPIFTSKDDSMFSLSFWGKQLQSQGYTLGIVGETFAEQAILASLTSGLGNVAGIGKLGKLSKVIMNPFVFGSYTGVKEAYLNALQTGEETYKQFKEQKYSDEEAKIKGNEAATLGFRREVLPLMVLNAFQFALVSKFNPFEKKGLNLGYSGGIETLSENLFKNVNNKFSNKLVKYGTNMFAEGTEEGYQTGNTKIAKYEIGHAAGIIGERDIGEILFEGDNEMRDSIVGGMLGGAMFAFAGPRLQKLSDNTRAKLQEQDYTEFLENSAKRVGIDLKNLKKAFDSGDETKVETVRKQIQRHNVFEALRLDLINQNSSAFNNYISMLEEIEKAVDEGDIEKLKKFDIKDVKDVRYIKENFKTFIDDAHNIKGKLIKNLQLTNGEQIPAFEITDAEKSIEELSEFEQRSKNKIEEFKNNNTQYNKLTDIGKKKIDLTVEKTALAAKASQNKITNTQKIRLEEINKELENIEKENNKELDNKITKALSLQELITEHFDILEYQQYQEKLLEKISYWKNFDNQKREKIKSAKRKIRQAKSKRQLQKAKQQLEKTNSLTPETKEVIDDKTEQVEVKELNNNKNKNSPENNQTNNNSNQERNQRTANIEAALARNVVTPDNSNNQNNNTPENTTNQNIPENKNQNNTNTPFGNVIVPDEEEINQSSKSSFEKIDNVISEDEKKEVNYDELPDEELYEPASIEDITQEQKQKLKENVSNIYENLKSEIGKEPTFEEFITEAIKNTNKETAERIYNSLVLGWKENNYKTTDFDKIYNDTFKSIKESFSNISDITEEVSNNNNKEEIEKSNIETVKEAVEEKSPPVTLDDNNRPKLKDSNPFKTSTPELRAAHLSIPYRREFIKNEDGSITILDTDSSSELNDPKHTNNKKILDPDSINPGTKLTIKIPENYKEINIQTWKSEITKGPMMTFGEWMRKNNIKEGSQEWINHVPMIAYDNTNDGIFFIHDTQWYNTVNVGLKDDEQKQKEVIDKAKENLNNLRNKVHNKGSVNIEITTKRPGTISKIPKSKKTITLNEANPDTQIGLVNKQGELLLNGEKVFESDGKTLINQKELNRGHVYDIRKSTTSNEYIALKAMREKINENSINTIKQIIKTYLYQYDKNNQTNNQNIKNQIRDITGLDVFSMNEFEKIINLYIHTVKGKFDNVKHLINTVENDDTFKKGTVYAAIQNGSFVFGIKGQRISGNNNALWIHPKKINDPNGQKQVDSILKVFDKLLPKFSQNISKEGLSNNRTTISIDETGQVTPSNDYRTFLKNNLKTNVRSFNVGTKEKPKYATIIQPTINFKEVENDSKEFEKTGKVSEEKKKEINEKIEDGKPLTSEEEVMKQEIPSQVNDEQGNKIDIIKTFKDVLKALRELGVNESNESIKFLKKELGITDNNDSVEVLSDVTDEDIKALKEDISGTNGLSIIQDFLLVDYIFNELSSKIDFKYKSSINKENILKEIKQAYFKSIESKVKQNEKILENLRAVYKEIESNSRLQTTIKELEDKIKIFNVIKENWSKIENKALEKLYKYTGIQESKIKEDDTGFTNDTVEKEKNYSKTSLEENGKTTSSYRLKRFFAGIKQIAPDGKVVTGFLGIPQYVSFDTVYSTVEQILSSPYEVDSDFNLMIKRLEENVNNYKWLQQVIDELKNADGQIKNEFVYNFARHALSMKFTMFSKNRDGTWSLKVYDTNANEITRVIRRQWESNFKQSSLVFIEDGQYKINKIRAKELLKTFNSWKGKIKSTGRKSKRIVNVSNIELQNWLNEFGISLSNDALNEMRNKDIEYVTNDGKELMSFGRMFDNTPNTAGIFGLMANYLENIISREDTEFETNPYNHPFNNANNSLKILSKIESKYSLYTTTNSFRDNKKSIYGFTPSKHATDVVKNLKFNEEFRNQLNNKSFNKHSYLLELLNNDEGFREKFHIDHIGITALKELGKSIYSDNSITSLSNSDQELTKLGLFQDTTQGQVKSTIGKNGFIGMRMARMFMPTMSDKKQMLSLYTAVLNLSNKHFIENENGTIKLGNELKEVLYNQLVKPELERITNFNSKVKSTNIKGYDTAAKMFLLIPELNNMFDSKTNKRVISLMINDPVNYDMKWFENNFKEKSKTILNSLVNNEVKNKIKEWENNGFVETKSGGKTIKFLNNKYFNKFNGSMEKKINLAANDFVINTLITNANIHMLVAGDIALYSQDKIKSYFKNGKPYLPKDQFGNSVYSKISKEIIGVNTGKRLALLLAPGSKLANSKNAKYKQLFLNDKVDISSNITSLVKMFYGNEEANYAKSRIKEYNNDKTIKGREIIAKELSKKYPEIADYFDIEATDAQEYTTLSEHINVLYGQGRLTDNQYETIKNKIKEQLEAEAENKEIPKSAILNYAEMKQILQPIKPVHTGFKNEEGYDAMRMMYIKSSSFPLIPQITKGTELDKLRRLLENHEKKSGKFVRASYQSANKVGAVTNAISPFLPDGTFNNNITDEEIESASLILNRDNFRIQQDVPFKSDKRNEDNVSLGTQTLKLLFGDGTLNIDNFTYNNKKYSGKELHSVFNNIYNDYINHRKKMLFKQLNIDKNGNSLKPKKTVKKLQNLLKREAIDRGYPKQDIEALKLYPITDSDGNIIDVQFNLPLWLSPNSNRYESLLNSIVDKKLVNIKLPGNSYVVGSEAGFKFQSDFNGVNQNNIIFTSKWEGELKAYRENKPTQVLLPSKFRDNNGNLIEFIDKDGNPNPTYTERDKNGVLRLKEEMIDKELLNLTSFRIPTSGHVSMSQVEVVGILPTEAGDLMIVPKNLTKQKGLDFDVDKETTYQLHTFVDENNKITTLNESAKQKILKAADTKGTKLLNDGSVESKLIKTIFGEDPDFNNEELDDNSFLGLLNDKLEQKLYENELIKIHNSVLSNSNNEMQKKINKVLSMDFAKSQAQLIQNELENNVDNTFFTSLSDSYQKDKMYLGASGKLGIGVYSNYVVFHSMVQQANKPIQLLTGYDKNTNEKKPLVIRIGNQESKGLLGNQESLAPKGLKRNIAEIFAEKQNTATDNEKEQIMGRVNVNDITINVDSLLSALGFDKDVLNNGTEVSIPYLLLSQPVIKEYVERIRKTESNTVEFDSSAKEKIIEELEEKYKITEEYDKEKIPYLLTGQNLFNNLTKPNKAIQLEVLHTFLKLDTYAKNLSVLQKQLNINSTGLGQSFFETIDKYYGIQNIINNNEQNRKGIIVENASNLIGDYVEINGDITRKEEENLISQGYIKMGNYLIKPNNPVGSMLVNSVKSGYELWKDHFPYNDRNIKLVTDEILSMISDESTSSQKMIEMQQSIFKEMKKFFVSSNKLGIFKGNPQKERNRLFIDSNENTSLSTYLKSILSTKSDVAKNLKSNKLISRFEFQLNKNGIPSIIKFDNTKGENFDEDYLYMSLIELMDKNIKLPNYNGKSYSTRELAKDLIAYSYLEGGVQEAIQFVKYIPVSYLNILPFSHVVRNWNNKFRPSIFKGILGVNPDSNFSSTFTRQYLQHNPQRLPKVNPDSQILNENYNGNKSGKLSELTSFDIDTSGMSDTELEKFQETKFVSIYNSEIKKGLKKFQVYERDSKGTYNRISTLGVFGMSEYSIKNDDVKTITNDYYKSKKPSNPIKIVKEAPTDVFGLENNSLQDVINSISNYNFTKNKHLQAIAKSLLPFINNDITIELGNLVNSKGQRIARGSYSNNKNKIIIDNRYYKSADNESLAKTIIHELIHGLTSDYISEYVNNQGKYKVPNPPKEIKQLVILFNETKKTLGDEIESYKKKREAQLSGKTNESTNERERTVAYAGTNIKEFVTLVMTEPNFQKEMMNVKYKTIDKSLFDKFSEIVNDILNKLFGENYNKNGVTYQGIKASLEIIDKQDKNKDKSEFKEMEKNDIASENLLNNNPEEITDENEVSNSKREISTNHPIFNERKNQIEYTDDQKVALNLVADFLESDDNFFLLAGFAGTGKTTIAENIHNYSDSYIIAPTNAAVERLRDKFMTSSNKDKFHTVHKLLYGEPDPITGEFVKPKLPHNSTIILDEASMLDKKILNDITTLAKENNTKVIFLGDSFQLEPVGENPHLFNKFNFKGWKTELREVKRQDNEILEVATHLRNVKKPEIIKTESDDFKVTDSFTNELKEDIKNDNSYVVLTTTNNSRIRINNYIRKEKFGERSDNIINDGEKLISIANVINKNSQQFEIKNPTILEEFTFQHDNKTYKAVNIEYEDKDGVKKEVLLIPGYDKASLYTQQLIKNEMFASNPNFVQVDNNNKKRWVGGDIAVYGYATTIHKSQGNEWNNVYITLPWMSNNWNKGKMIYTAITRGKNKVRLSKNDYIKVVNKPKNKSNNKKVKNKSLENNVKPTIKINVDKSMPYSQLKQLPVYSDKGVNTMRKSGNEHFGNPFTGIPSVAEKNPNLILMPSVKSAVDAYEDWLLDDNSSLNPEQRKWIINEIKQGKLDNANLLYMNDKTGYESHADALKEVVKELRNNDTNIEPLDNVTLISGGANGIDTMFDDIAEEFGIKKENRIHHIHEAMPTSYLTPLQKERGVLMDKKHRNEANQYLSKVAEKTFGKKTFFKWDSYGGAFVLRDYMQVENSDMVIAVSKLIPKGGTLLLKGNRTTKRTSPAGGELYAVGVGIEKKLPVYVYNLEDNGNYKQGLYKYDYEKNDYVLTDEIPLLPSKFTGIGLLPQEMNTEQKRDAQNFIRSLFENSKNNFRLPEIKNC